MNIRLLTKVAALVLLTLGFYTTTNAQLTVDVSLTPDQMTQSLVGNGVTISNTLITAADSSYGAFNSIGTEIGTTNGLLLTTGSVFNAIGPNDDNGFPDLDDDNNCLNCDLFDNDFPGNALLSSANGNLTTWDACLYEFDIVPQGDSLSFEYHFASEEYLEWVGSSFNDVFGFYISGPGGLVDVNIATIPGTTDAVAINSVNHIDNTEFFFNNITPAGDGVQYDGFTTNTIASIGNLIPCETYHIKLIIADGSDHLYDSGVFISKIESNPAAIETTTVEGLPYMIEGCNNGNINIINPFPVDGNTDVQFTLTGDAVFGVDFNTNPDISAFYDVLTDSYTMTILDGETTIGFEVIPIFDGINEGTELINIDLLYQLCDNTLETSAQFEITDELPVSIDTFAGTICPGDCITLNASAETQGTATFAWSPTTGMTDELTLTPTVCPDVTTTYTLTNQAGACVNTESITVVVTPLTATFDITNATCADSDAGAINITMTSGLADYTYSWTGPNSFSSSDEDITGLEVGEYCVTVIDATLCSTEFCVDIIIEDIIDVTSDISDFGCANEVSCNGLSDGFIHIDISGGVFPYDTDWTLNGLPFSTDEDIDDLAAGTYEVTITDFEGCVDVNTYIIDEPAPVSVGLEGVVDVLCNGESNGVITINAEGGCGPYTYSWSHDANLVAATATVATGDYIATAVDVNLCASIDTVSVTVLGPALPVTVVIDNILLHPGGFNVSCPDAQDGEVDITISGGTPGILPLYTIEWLHVESGTIITDEDPTGMECGVWQLSVTDDNDCTNTQEVILTCVPPIVIDSDIVQNGCEDPNGGAGEITINSISGGHGGAYTIVEWTGPSCGGTCGTGMSITGLDSGNYTVEITDALGCSQIFTFNVGTNDELTVTETITDLNCFNVCDGVIDIEVNQALDSTQWFGPNGFESSNLESITELCSGNYSLTAFSQGCQETFIYNVASSPEIVVNPTFTEPSCFGVNNGTIQSNASGGTGILTYEWTADEDCFFPNPGDVPNINDLLDCTYYLTVTDNEGCFVEDSLTFTSPEVMGISVSLSDYNGFVVSCPDASDGSASAVASDGNPDCDQFAPDCYNYEWFVCGEDEPFTTGSFVNNLGAGCYTVLATDTAGCIATTNIPFTAPLPNTMAVVIEPLGCNDTIADVEITYSGGAGTIVSYEWIEGDISPNEPDATTLLDLPLGNYCVVVTDNNDCFDTLCFEIAAPEVLTINTVTLQNVSCFGGNDGLIDVIGSNGFEPYQYSWDEAPFELIGLNDSLTAGNYTVTVVDDLGCQNTMEFIITEPELLTVTLTAPTNVENPIFTIPCKGDTIVLVPVIEGGTLDYDYLWQNCDDTFISNNAGNIDATVGCYELIITDNNGCIAQDTIEVTEPDEFLLTDTSADLFPNGFNVSCGGAEDGGICSVVSGGVPGYDFFWTQDNEEFSTDSCITELPAGLYELIIIDANGCEMLETETLTEPPPIELGETVTHVTCFDACDGSIVINPTGGSGVLNIDWDPTAVDPLSLQNLCDGDYTVTVSDNFDCEVEQTFTINQPDEITAVLEVTDISCFGEGDGSIDVTASGGSGSFDCSWDNGDNTCSISSLEAGIYCDTIRDANELSCFIVLCEEILEPTLLELSLTTTDATCGLSNGTVVETPSGGTPEYTFDWNGIDPDGVSQGAYSVTLEDANGCSVIETFNIGGPVPPEYTESITHLDCPGTASGEIDLTLTGGASPTSVCWELLDGTSISCTNDLDELSGGTYVLVIEWGDDCTTTDDNFTVDEPNPIIINGSVSTPIFDFNISTYGGDDGFINTNTEGGTQLVGGPPNYIYSWTDEDGTIIIGNDNLTNLTAGEYNLTVTDANNCTQDTTFLLTEVPEIALPTGITPNGDGTNDFYYILGIEEHGANTFTVFNRWGNIVYEVDNYDNVDRVWNGTNNDNEDLPNGTYYIVYDSDKFDANTFVDLRR